MSRLTHSIVVALCSCLAVACCVAPLEGQQVTAFFSPRGGAEAAIIQVIANATTSIDVAAYRLTNPTIIAALDAAAARGIPTRIILDRANESNTPTALSRLRQRGVIMKTDRIEKLFHHKFAVIDGTTTITGSFNWTDNAQDDNAENLIVIRDAAVATAFAANFAKHWVHSSPFVPRNTTTKSPPGKRQARPQLSNPSPHAHVERFPYHGTSYWSPPLRHGVGHIREVLDLFPMEWPTLRSRMRHSEESEVCQADRRSVDDVFLGSNLAWAWSPSENLLGCKRNGTSHLGLQCVCQRESITLAACPRPHFHLSGRRGFHAVDRHDADAYRCGRLRYD